jgi:hypothetical protein
VTINAILYQTFRPAGAPDFPFCDPIFTIGGRQLQIQATLETWFAGVVSAPTFAGQSNLRWLCDDGERSRAARTSPSNVRRSAAANVQP